MKVNMKPWAIMVLILGIAAITAGIYLAKASNQIAVLRQEVTLRDELLAIEKNKQDSLFNLLPGLRDEIAESTKRINELQASRAWWFNRAQDNEATIDSLLQATFTGPDSLLARLVYEQWRSGPRN